MNEPDEPTDHEPTTTEEHLLGLATDTDEGTTSSAGESEAAGPTADDAAPSPAEAPAPAADPDPANPAAELARMREDIARQKAEIARLTHLTSLQGGGPVTPPSAPKRFAELSEREMETEITRMANDLDGF